MPKKLIWVDIHKKRNTITPTYYFDFEYLNSLGFQDKEMLTFLEEMKSFAEKELKERSDLKAGKNEKANNP